MDATPSPEEFAAEYAATRTRIRDVVADAGLDAAAARPVPACPAWNVRDVLAHMAGVARDLVERNGPGPDVQAWVDRQVAERSTRPVGALLDEWDEFGRRFEALIVKVPHAFAGLLLDVVAHEHDLRHTLHRPGARDATAVRVSMSTAAELLTRDLDAHALPAVRLSAGGDTWTCGTADRDAPGLTLDLGPTAEARWELFRLVGSRRSKAQMAAYPWQGDWERFLPGLAHMPLPERDILE